jgi:hypothetical protein
MNPVVSRRAGIAARETGHIKQIVQLCVGKLDEQIREERPSGFADDRIIKRAGDRAWQVADAVAALLPSPARLAPLTSS